MLNRRTFITSATALAVAPFAWSQSVPKELTFAVIPVESASLTTDRFGPLAKYLGDVLGIPVTLRIANDYAAVIEGQRAGNAHIAWYGPASYARAVMTGVKTEPLVNQRHETGVNGYYSVLWVRADSPYKSVHDLKGKTLALVDPNSTSGNNAPRFFLSKNEGITNIESFFGKVFFAGSHQNALLALAQGTADAAANEYFTPSDNIPTRLAEKGLLKDANGKALRPSDLRIVFKSDLLPDGPFSALESLPAELRQKIRQALLDLPKNNRQVFDGLSNGKDQEMVAVDAKLYEPIIEMLKFNDAHRKQ
jgi:phosphonate transport system substrate-binding protein